MARLSAITIAVDQVVGLADRVADLDTQAFSRAAVAALNTTVDATYELARDRITTGINITDDYLRRRMSVEHAKGSKLQAEIVASGDAQRMTRLVHYGAQMLIVPRKTTTPSRSQGSLLRLGSGSKQGGVRVNVKSPKTMVDAFMLPLKRGSQQGEKMGVFRREGNKLKHLYGPSVYQLFRYQSSRIEDEVAGDLQANLLDQVDEQIRKVLT